MLRSRSQLRPELRPAGTGGGQGESQDPLRVLSRTTVPGPRTAGPRVGCQGWRIRRCLTRDHVPIEYPTGTCHCGSDLGEHRAEKAANAKTGPCCGLGRCCAHCRRKNSGVALPRRAARPQASSSWTSKETPPHGAQGTLHSARANTKVLAKSWRSWRPGPSRSCPGQMGKLGSESRGAPPGQSDVRRMFKLQLEAPKVPDSDLKP
jgi:hypothetical protein